MKPALTSPSIVNEVPGRNGSRRAGFNYAVNGFRGVCILLVFVYHVYNSGLLPKPPYDSSTLNALAFFVSSFRYGVELFFMISGYVIVASLKRHRSVGSFLWDRFARIYPVWVPVHVGIFTMGVMFGLKRFHDMSLNDEVVTFFANLVLLPPLIDVPVTHDASWSLSYEWLFYLLAAAAVAVTHFRVRVARALLWSVWTLAVIALLCLLPRALFFIPGAIVGLGWVPLDKLKRGATFPVLALISLLIAWRWVDIDEARPGAYALNDFLGMTTLPFTLISLALGLYAFVCVCRDDGRMAWLEHRVTQFFGNISYSFYLWHPIVMFVVKRIAYAYVVPEFGRPAGLWMYAVVSFVIATAISYASYRVLEVRVSKTLRHLFKPSTERSLVVESAVVTPLTAHVDGKSSRL